MRSNRLQLILAFVYTITLQTILIFLYDSSDGHGTSGRILQLLGGDFVNGGYIQAVTYLVFFVAILQIRHGSKRLKAEGKLLGSGLLPEQEHYVMYEDDVKEIQEKVIEQEKEKSSAVLEAVKKVCTKFLRTGSVAEMIEVLSAQGEVYERNIDGFLSLVRYYLWAIPSLGFIGTVIGISSSLGAVSSDDPELVIKLLSVAFDTTLVALVLSLVSMLLFHDFQARLDRFLGRFREYILENLINRIVNK